jgi:hypothetical protein
MSASTLSDDTAPNGVPAVIPGDVLGSVELSSDDEARIEFVAEAIYRGLYPKENEHAIGRTRDWKTDAPWDTNPEELCEHERDEYRVAARKAIFVLRALDAASAPVTEPK